MKMQNTSFFGNTYTFTARRFDDKTGLYYFRNRYYEADNGRFVSRDPLGYEDGMSLYAAFFIPNGIDPLGTNWQAKVSPNWTPNPNWLPDKNVNYQLFIDFTLPKVPAGSTQVWQTNHIHWWGITKDDKIKSENEYIVDVVDIGGRKTIGDTLSLVDNQKYCFYIRHVTKHQGFNPVNMGGSYKEQSKYVTKALHDRIKGQLHGPKGQLEYTYFYVNCAHCGPRGLAFLSALKSFALMLKFRLVLDRFESIQMPGVITKGGSW